jgi:hypothetical protein
MKKTRFDFSSACIDVKAKRMPEPGKECPVTPSSFGLRH